MSYDNDFFLDQLEQLSKGERVSKKVAEQAAKVTEVLSDFRDVGEQCYKELSDCHREFYTPVPYSLSRNLLVAEKKWESVPRTITRMERTADNCRIQELLSKKQRSADDWQELEYYVEDLETCLKDVREDFESFTEAMNTVVSEMEQTEFPKCPEASVKPKFHHFWTSERLAKLDLMISAGYLLSSLTYKIVKRKSFLKLTLSGSILSSLDFVASTFCTETWQRWNRGGHLRIYAPRYISYFAASLSVFEFARELIPLRNSSNSTSAMNLVFGVLRNSCMLLPPLWQVFSNLLSSDMNLVFGVLRNSSILLPKLYQAVSNLWQVVSNLSSSDMNLIFDVLHISSILLPKLYQVVSNLPSSDMNYLMFMVLFNSSMFLPHLYQVSAIRISNLCQTLNERQNKESDAVYSKNSAMNLIFDVLRISSMLLPNLYQVVSNPTSNPPSSDMKSIFGVLRISSMFLPLLYQVVSYQFQPLDGRQNKEADAVNSKTSSSGIYRQSSASNKYTEREDRFEEGRRMFKKLSESEQLKDFDEALLDERQVLLELKAWIKEQTS